MVNAMAIPQPIQCGGSEKRERILVIRVEEAIGLVIQLNNNKYINAIRKNVKRKKNGVTKVWGQERVS